MDKAVKKEKRSLLAIFALIFSAISAVLGGFSNIVNTFAYIAQNIDTQFFSVGRLLYLIFNPASLIGNIGKVLLFFMLLLALTALYKKSERRLLYPISFIVYLTLSAINSFIAPVIVAAYTATSIPDLMFAPQIKEFLAPLFSLISFTIPLIAYFITVMAVNIKEYKALRIVFKIVVSVLIAVSLVTSLINGGVSFMTAFVSYFEHGIINSYLFANIIIYICSVIGSVLSNLSLLFAVLSVDRVVKYKKADKFTNLNEKNDL